MKVTADLTVYEEWFRSPRDLDWFKQHLPKCVKFRERENLHFISGWYENAPNNADYLEPVSVWWTALGKLAGVNRP